MKATTDIAAALRDKFEAAELDVSEVARATGISGSTLRAFFYANRGYPATVRSDTASKLLEFFDLQIVDRKRLRKV